MIYLFPLYTKHKSFAIMSVPVFIDLESNNQIAELRSYLKSKGADISEENTDESLEDNLAQVINVSELLWKEGINDAEIESVINSIITLVIVLPSDKSEGLTTTLCEQLGKFNSSDKRNPIRLRLLNNLYTGLEETSPLRYIAYMALIRLAGQSEQLHQLNFKVEDLKILAGQWNIGTTKYQALLRVLHEVFLENKQNDRAAKVMVELLGTYVEENAAQAREDARRCIVTCLADPNVFLFDHLLTLKPVKFLEGEPVHDLLTIFVSGKLPQYLSFYESNKEFITANGLSNENNVHKMRILTFLQISEGKSELSFDSVQSELQLPADEVEAFVIDVVRTKAARVKIDQMSKKLLICTTVNRTFGRSQWIFLREQLAAWQGSIVQIQNGLTTVLQH